MKKPLNVLDKDLMTKDKAIEFVEERIEDDRILGKSIRDFVLEAEKDNEVGISFQKEGTDIIIKELKKVQSCIDDVVTILQRNGGLDLDLWRSVLCWINGEEIYWRSLLKVINDSTEEELRSVQSKKIVM